MSQQTHTYRDLSYDLIRSSHSELLIQIDAASFSYAITYEKELVALETDCSLNELSDPQDLADELTANYKDVVIGLPAKSFTLVPIPLFSEDQIVNYARLLDVKADEKVLAQKLDEQNFIIYTVDEKTIALVQRFGVAKTIYLSKGRITAVAQSNPSNNELYVHTENGKAEFLYFKDGNIRFYNSFNFTDENDIAYYAAFVAEELKLSPESLNLKLSGDVVSEAKYSTLLSRFYASVSFFDPQLLNLPGHIPSQQILNLVSLSLCGSSEVA